ncbi:MAG: hypothetical protein HY721_00610, partial [Planctomycetes bacterium]|nr:hypothetical protein [Planctomycetota bacterium]
MPAPRDESRRSTCRFARCRSARPGGLLFLGLLFAGGAPAAEIGPFEALRSGAVRPSPLRGLEELWLGSPGREAVPVRADGTYRLEGLPVGLPVRALGTLPLPGPSLHSGPAVLAAAASFQGAADVTGPGGPVPIVHALDVRGPAGTRTLSFSTAGQKTLLLLRGETVGGEPYGLALGPLESPAVRLEASDSAVATVSASGEVTARGPGRAWVRASGDGGWSQVLVDVDLRLDSDGDGMPDSYEIARGFDPRNPADGAADADADGLSNRREHELGLDPRNDDTDNDLIPDGAEFAAGTDPRNPDTDGDLSIDGSEVEQGSDPLDPNVIPGSPFTPSFKVSQNLSAPGVRAAVSANDHIFVVTSDGRIISYRLDASNWFIIFQDIESLSADLRDIAVEGSTAYVAAGAAGLHLVDVTAPASLVRTATVTGLGTVNGVLVRDGVVFLATDSGLRILRRGAGGALETAGTLAVPGFSRFAVADSLAFLGAPSINRLISVDISDIAAPRERQRFVLPASTQPFRAVAASGRTVFVAHGNAGLISVSAEDPAALRIVDTSAPEFPGAVFDSVALLGNRLAAHTAAANAKAQLYRIRDDGSLDPAGDVGGNASGAGQLIWVQNYLVGLSGGSVAVSQVLRAGDRGSAGPLGGLVLDGGRDVLVAGDELVISARVRDDVFVEGVDFS